jgi:hypothetical protein
MLLWVSLYYCCTAMLLLGMETAKPAGHSGTRSFKFGALLSTRNAANRHSGCNSGIGCVLEAFVAIHLHSTTSAMSLGGPM